MDFVRERLTRGCNMTEYWRLLRSIRTSANGVFGWKMFITDYFNCGRQSPEFLKLIVPTKVVFITREDLVYQAVSYSKAIRSEQWFKNARAKESPAYDAKHIQQCIDTIQYQIDFWERLFDLAGASVFHVTYESMLRDIESVIENISAFIGVKDDTCSVVDIPKMAIQRNAESSDWVERYTREVVDD